MSTLILHHYPMSPFSEKIRAMLGYTGLEWQSVITKEMPPRPMVAQLAGGYRKIPVAQIGADVFCDSRTIATEIATLSGKPELALENISADAQSFVSRVDAEIFFACIIAGASRPLYRKVMKTMTLFDVVRFFWDRINLGRSSTIKRVSPKQARAIVKVHLAQLETLLQQDFLFGQQPCNADFAAYHSAWFMRDLGERSIIDVYPKTSAWMDRIKAYGHGIRTEITGQQALEAAKNSQPRPIPAEHQTDALIGKKVQIAPSDYCQIGTPGILVGSAPSQWILAREEPRLGTLHLHFPKPGFTLNLV